MHPVYVHNGFLVLAFVFFLFEGFGFRLAPPSRISWVPLGYACVVGAFVFPFFV